MFGDYCLGSLRVLRGKGQPECPASAQGYFQKWVQRQTSCSSLMLLLSVSYRTLCTVVRVMELWDSPEVTVKF